jgi:hypothetical protein
MSRNALEQLFVEPNDSRTRSEDSTHFDKLAHASRALEGSDFSTFEKHAAEASIFALLDSQNTNTQEPVDVERVLQAPAANSNRGRIFAALGAVALALLIIPFLANDDRETSEWQARSAQTLPIREQPRVQVYCVQRDVDSLDFIGQNESPFGAVTCASNDDLKIAYENPDASLKYAYFVGVSATGETLWYGPTPVDPTPFSIGVTVKPTPIGETRRLAVNHSLGRYMVYGLFSPNRISFNEFESMVERMKISDDVSGVSPAVLVRAEFEVKK